MVASTYVPLANGPAGILNMFCQEKYLLDIQYTLLLSWEYRDGICAFQTVFSEMP